MSDIDKINKVEQLITTRARNKASRDADVIRSEIQKAVGSIHKNTDHIHSEIKEFLPEGFTEEHTKHFINAIVSKTESRKTKIYIEDEANKVRDMLNFMDREIN